MQEQAVSSAGIWTVLLPVMIGSGLTLLGVALGPAVAHVLTSRSSRHARRVEKFEELFSLLDQQSDWLDINRVVRAFGDNREIPPEPLPKAIAIAALHFPQFVPNLKAVQNQSKLFVLWTIQAAQRRLEGNIATIGQGSGEAWTPFYEAFADARDRLTAYAISTKGNV